MNMARFETTFCAFKQAGTYNPALVEKPVNPSSVPFSPLQARSFSLLDPYLNMPSNEVYCIKFSAVQALSVSMISQKNEEIRIFIKLEK